MRSTPPLSSDEVQNNADGVLGKTCGLIAGETWHFSTILINSCPVGSRQPSVNSGVKRPTCSQENVLGRPAQRFSAAVHVCPKAQRCHSNSVLVWRTRLPSSSAVNAVEGVVSVCPPTQAPAALGMSAASAGCASSMMPR